MCKEEIEYEYYEKLKELHKMVENGEAFGKGGLTPEQRADLERRTQECRELEKKYEGVGTVFSRDNYVIDTVRCVRRK